VKDETGDLVISIYPGNTKAQGAYLFSTGGTVSETVIVAGKTYKIDKAFHIKFTSWQRYFTGLWFYDKNLKKDGLYSREIFNNFAGRNSKDSGQWDQLEMLFDEYFKEEFDWKKHMDWNGKIKCSGKNRFDVSFGYGISLVIPFSELKATDNHPENFDGLTALIKSCYTAFENELITYGPGVNVAEPSHSF